MSRTSPKPSSLAALVVANNGWTGGEFDYVTCSPHTCLSWAGIYEDSENGATPEQPFWWLKVLYQAPDGHLVITSSKGLLRRALPKNGIIHFNAALPFGLLPTGVADAVIREQSLDIPEYRTFLEMITPEAPLTQPKLVWDWSDATGQVFNY